MELHVNNAFIKYEGSLELLRYLGKCQVATTVCYHLEKPRLKQAELRDR